jgi:hypothetical protein
MSRNLVKNCMQATGKSPAATLLLMRIMYWNKYASIVREGKTWVARTQSEWCDETELTPQQVKDGFALLRNRMLIETRKGVFANKIVGFVRLTDRGEQVHKNEGDQCLKTPTSECLQTPTYIHGETYKSSSYLSDTTNSTCATPSGSELLSGGDQAIAENVSKEAPMVSVKDILASGGKHTKPKTSKAVTVSALTHHWQEQVAQACSIFVPPLTMKAQGQLRQFMKACPNGQEQSILSTVIQNWQMFTAAAKSAAGTNTAPAIPNLDYLIKHLGVAINFGKDAPEPTVKSHVSGQPKPEVQLTSHAEPVEKASKDEIEEILGIKLKKGAGP